MPDRLPCLVPFCRRTRHDDGRYREWICGPHWGGVPAAQRAVYRRARAALTRATTADEASYVRLVAVPEHWRLAETDPIVVSRMRAAWQHAMAIGRCCRLWAACRRHAIEAAAGIGGARG